MKFLTARKLLGITALALLLGLSISSETLAQGRHGHRGGWGGNDKKCGKFVNCHDARDGRWDGRGPKRQHAYRYHRFWHRYRNHR